jgi:hypothetical protein
MHRSLTALTLFSALLCAAPLSALAASLYSVTGLGILPGGYLTSTATSIDNQGEVAGYSIATNGFNRAFYWTPAGGLVALTGSESNSRALGVNNGNVVGQIDGQAYRWT